EDFTDEVSVGNIIIKAITSTNHPILQEIPIFTAMKCWI
ncbi:unnamed protein product, partial [marine sediment metagenome]